LLYLSAGLAPVATADPPMPFEKKLANMALDAHIEKQNIPPSSVPADEPNFLAVATVYKQHCALCHRLPGQPPMNYATTMFPKPPQLFRGKGVTGARHRRLTGSLTGIGKKTPPLQTLPLPCRTSVNL
jgi:thiosulfate dehydrogenase